MSDVTELLRPPGDLPLLETDTLELCPGEGDIVVHLEEPDPDPSGRSRAGWHQTTTRDEERSHPVPVARLPGRTGDNIVQSHNDSIDRSDIRGVGCWYGDDDRMRRCGALPGCTGNGGAGNATTIEEIRNPFLMSAADKSGRLARVAACYVRGAAQKAGFSLVSSAKRMRTRRGSELMVYLGM